MTDEEAKTRMENLIYFYIPLGDSLEAIDKAIEALEKQTPKKPIKLNCPNCGFDKIDNSWWVFTYCPKCGQRLDWEGIE